MGGSTKRVWSLLLAITARDTIDIAAAKFLNLECNFFEFRALSITPRLCDSHRNQQRIDLSPDISLLPRHHRVGSNCDCSFAQFGESPEKLQTSRSHTTEINMEIKPIKMESERAVLLVVDVQPDFLPGGSLPVPAGDEILPALRDLMNSGRFKLIVATQDWHPREHVSFASNHVGRAAMDSIELYGHEQTLWPDHCIHNTPGAALHPSLPWERATAIIRKATDPAIDSYSAFRNNWNSHGNRPPTGLTGYLKDRGVEEVFVCGLARDYCVKWSAEDALQEGFRVSVIWDLCRSIDPSRDEQIRGELSVHGADIVSADQLMPVR